MFSEQCNPLSIPFFNRAYVPTDGQIASRLKALNYPL